MLRRIAVVAGVLVALTSCQKFAEGRQMFHDLLALRDQIAREFHERVVDVNVSRDNAVTVKFINSPLNSAPRDAKQKRADEVASFVASHYTHPVASVSTQFATSSGPATIEETFVGRPAANAPR